MPKHGRKARARKRPPGNREGGIASVSRPGLRVLAKVVLAAAIIAVAVGAVHWPKIAPRFNMFYWETVQYVDHVQRYVHSIPDCFRVPPLWPGLYRPVSTNLYFYLGLKYGGVGVEHFKIFNLCVYGANALLLFLIAWRWLPWGWAVAASLLFATRDAHVDIVTTAVEAQSLLAVFFALMTLYLFVLAREGARRWWDWLAMVMFTVAIFCKETAVIMPVVLLAYCWLLGRGISWRPLAFHAAIAAVWTLLFVTIFRGLRDHTPTSFRYTASPIVILKNVAGHLVDYSNLLVADLEETNMGVNRRMYDITRNAATLAGTALLMGSTVLAVVGKARLGQDLRVAIFGVVFFALATSPYLLFTDRLYMRYSYAGHVGVSLAVVAGARVLWSFLSPHLLPLLRRRSPAS